MPLQFCIDGSHTPCKANTIKQHVTVNNTAVFRKEKIYTDRFLYDTKQEFILNFNHKMTKQTIDVCQYALNKL